MRVSRRPAPTELRPAPTEHACNRPAPTELRRRHALYRLVNGRCALRPQAILFEFIHCTKERRADAHRALQESACEAADDIGATTYRQASTANRNGPEYENLLYALKPMERKGTTGR